MGCFLPVVSVSSLPGPHADAGLPTGWLLLSGTERLIL